MSLPGLRPGPRAAAPGPGPPTQLAAATARKNTTDGTAKTAGRSASSTRRAVPVAARAKG